MSAGAGSGRPGDLHAEDAARANTVQSGYDAATAVPPSVTAAAACSDGYGSHAAASAAAVASAGYDAANAAYSVSEGAAAAGALSPAALRRADHDRRRDWEARCVFPWTHSALIRAAQTVHSAASTTAATVTADAPRSSASYQWRHARWQYLCSYPPTAWNALYQALFESVPASPFEARRKAAAQEAIVEQFQHFSRNVVELIMEEIHLPADAASTDAATAASSDPDHLHSKFLPPLAVGGLAGGEKFLCNSILFKFARDWAGLFSAEALPGGGDADAAVQKSAANEMRAMNAIIGHNADLMMVAPLAMTLTCLVRVRGSVVICTALAPIQGRASLVYGSADAGRDIQDAAEEPRVQRVVQQLAEDWKLAAHPVVDAAQRLHMLPLACDIEVHLSRSDGRLYMLDLARFFPPTPPSAGSMEHLYLSLRPEWMRGPDLVASLPLSADVFSGFGVIDNAQHSAAVLANMRAMKYATMPRVAQALQRWWDEFRAQPDADLSSPCAVASAEETPLSSRISQILHAEGINVRFLSLVRCYVPSSPSPASAADSAESLPSLSMLLLYDVVARTCKQLYFGWIRRMMLAVGHMHEQETCSSPAATVSSIASPASPTSGRSGWTDADLERWLRSVNQEPEPDADAAPAVASSFHHESALLFALLLSLLFGGAGDEDDSDGRPSSRSFFADLLWPSVEVKFGKWNFSETERVEYERECAQRGEPTPNLPRPSPDATPLVSLQDRRAFETACRSLCGSSNAVSPSISIFLRMLLESVGLDWFALRHALARLSIDGVSTPRDFVRQLVPRVLALNESSAAAALDLQTVALVFMPSFQPQLKRVRCLPFLSLAESESQLLASLAARSAALQRTGQDARNPALLSTLWAIVTLYEVHRDQDAKQAPNAAAAAALSADSSAPLSCFEKGRAILLQIESIYALLLDGVVSLSATARRDVESQIHFGKFGWFFLRFGQLARAREYFAREHALRAEAVAREESEMVASASAGASDATSSVPPSLLLLAQSLESMGIISRELGDLAASLAFFKACLGAYERIYGIDLEAEQKTDGPEDAEEDDSPAAHFRRSLELSNLWTNLANSYGSVGDLARKRRFLELALDIVQKHHSTPAATAAGAPTPHPSQIQIVCALSTCFSGPEASVEEIHKAQSMLQQCLEWNRALHGTCKRTQPVASSSVPVTPSSDPSDLEFEDEHASSAALFTTLANVFGRLPGMLPRKIRLLERALSLVSRHSGLLHPECAVILTNLGMAQGQAGGAAGIARGLATLQQALALKTKLYGTALHNEVALTLSNLSVLYGAAGDLQQEMRSLTQALQIFMTVLQKQAMAARDAASSSSTAVSSPAAASDLPASASALASNPALVCTQQRLFRCRQRLLAAQSALVAAGRCTFVASGSNRTIQAWWKCLTCSPNPKSGLGCCEACRLRCHEGHVLEAQEPSSFYCDCGEGVFPAPCCALKPREAADVPKTE